MRRPIFHTTAWALTVIAVYATSTAQMVETQNSNVDGASLVESLSIEEEHLGISLDEQSKPAPAGYISGTVLDQSGAVSVGAAVRLSRGGQTSDQELRSGKNGQFVFGNVSAGPFRLTVTASGFAPQEFSAAVRPGETYLVPPLVLVVAPAVTNVSVEGTALTPVQLADLQVREQEKQRVFGFIPNFYVTYKRDAAPLNSRQKFGLAWKTIIDPFTVVGVAGIAGLEQATNAFPGYGQGAEGYFKRFGASYADVVTGTYIGSAIFPSLLKQDPRYFYKGTGSIGSRLLYALGSPILCKGDNMRWQPNYSNVAGTFASAGISYLYYPRTDHQGADLIVQNSLIRVGEVAFEGVLQEFVIRRLTPRLKNRASDSR